MKDPTEEMIAVMEKVGIDPTFDGMESQDYQYAILVLTEKIVKLQRLIVEAAENGKALNDE